MRRSPQAAVGNGSKGLAQHLPAMSREQDQAVPKTRIEEGIHRLRGEYLEMPGLHLTREQVRRLWGLDAATCDAVIDALVDAGFLRRTQSGAYVRVADGGV